MSAEASELRDQQDGGGGVGWPTVCVSGVVHSVVYDRDPNWTW